MKPRTLLSTTALLGVALLTTSAFAVPGGWTDDYEAARTEAASSDKDLLLDFTGSDWCGWCIKLREEVFDTEAFKAAAPDDFVMVELDFPNNVPQSDEVKAQNAQLGEKFNVQGYPTIILADATGKPYAQTGYQAGGPESYLAHLDQLQAKREARDEAMAAAESAEGVEKAKALDTAMEAVGLELAATHYGDTIGQIIELDVNDEAGLKTKYLSVFNMQKTEAAMEGVINTLRNGDLDKGLLQLDELIETHQPQGEQLQYILTIKGRVHYELGQMESAVEALNDSVKVAPDSDMAAMIKEKIEEIKAEAAADE